MPLGPVENYIGKIDTASSVKDVYDILGAQVQHLGFERFAYQLVWPEEGPPQYLYINSLPSKWTEHFIKQKYVKSDVITLMCSQIIRPFLWEEIQSSNQLTLIQNMILNEAKEIGLRAGGTVPIHGPGNAKALLSVTADMKETEFKSLFKSKMHELWITASYAHERMISIGIKEKHLPQVMLTPMEVEIMRWTASGKSFWDISQILQVSERSVQFHTRRICQKYGVASKIHASVLTAVNKLFIP